MKTDLELIQPVHLARSAVVYIRQSTMGQVEEHRESARNQLKLRERAIQCGWSSPCVIDEDLGKSASGTSERSGFETLLRRIELLEVGIVFVIDASRMSRNSRDWGRFFEMCRYANVLIADASSVYDLSLSNHRILIGMKGTFAEMELDAISTRMRAGIESKAARGILRTCLPIGYTWDNDKIVMTPDERIRTAVHALFDRFDQSTSICQLARDYIEERLEFPMRSGKRVVWKLPSAEQLRGILANPSYSGVYVFGRTTSEVRIVDGRPKKSMRSFADPRNSRVFIENHHVGYISAERYERNRKKVADNRPFWGNRSGNGAVRDGKALLVGIVKCGRCGFRIRSEYGRNRASYVCNGGDQEGSRACGSFGSHQIDSAIGGELQRAVQDHAVLASIRAAEMHSETSTARTVQAKLRVQSAEFESARVAEQFDCCDPKNRLVAATLEERLNQRLADLEDAKAHLAQIESTVKTVSDQAKTKFKGLVADFPEFWRKLSDNSVAMKRVLRTCIDEVIFDHKPDDTWLNLIVRWKGGCHTLIKVPRNQRHVGSRADSDLVELVKKIAAQHSDAEIARILGLMKRTTPAGLSWSKDRVSRFRRQHGIPQSPQNPDPRYLTLNQAQKYLRISYNGIKSMISAGAITPSQVTDFAPMQISKNQLDSEQVQRLVSYLKQHRRLPKGGSPEDVLELFDTIK